MRNENMALLNKTPILDYTGKLIEVLSLAMWP